MENIMNKIRHNGPIYPGFDPIYPPNDIGGQWGITDEDYGF